MKALILAAGKGTRISDLTQHCPKPMLPVAGRPLLEHLLVWLRRYGISQIAINLHYLPEVIVNHFRDGQAWDVALTYSYEPTLLGTAGAAKALSAFLDEPFVVLYGDVFTNVDLARVLHFHEEHCRNAGSLLTVALYHVPNPTECGLVEINAQGRVTHFVEKPPAHEIFTDLANSGILVCEPEVLAYIPAGVAYDFGRNLLPRLLADHQPVYGQTIAPTEFVVDIGTPAGYARAQQTLLSTFVVA
jgi:NDP-sugar pyrophosphorylase family protein